MGLLQELESIVNKAGYWEVLQRGGVSLTQMWDAYRESEDADAYAKVLTAIIFSAGGLLLRSRLGISEDTLQVFPSSDFFPVIQTVRQTCGRCRTVLASFSGALFI